MPSLLATWAWTPSALILPGDYAVAPLTGLHAASKPAARRELEALPDQPLRRVDRVIAALGEELRPKGSVKLQATDLYRVRVGSYRVVYRVNDGARIVEVTRVGHRRDM